MKLSEAVLNIVNRALKYVRQAYDLVESHSCWRGVHNHCKKKRKERKNSKDFAANAEYATLFHNQMNAFSFFLMLQFAIQSEVLKLKYLISPFRLRYVFIYWTVSRSVSTFLSNVKYLGNS